jgi:H/ACA ribonucleoprotein complex subunit 2
MAKDKSESEIREKKEKKDKKRKHDEVVEDGPSSAKKDKKKKRKSTDAEHAVDADGDIVIDAPLAATTETVTVKGEDGDSKEVVRVQIPLAALVPFANPLADEKNQKKVMKSVKKGMLNSRSR